jgi:phenylalanine-4-hydroxylase
MPLTHQKLLDKVPVHLQQYVVEQDYGRYTPRDQAVWRYIMRKNLNFLGKHAHVSYLNGLKKTGISINKIPDVLEMNQLLERIGWNAVVVNGFIPPAAFMEFQANRILVVSAEMRSIEHILYTPAPDIVHEAAGHAPIIADPEYAEFLQKFGEYGSKAIASKEDFAVYEAIRKLSIVKEYPNATADEIQQAEQDLERQLANNRVASEAAKLSRMHWWTVEYGLIGSPDNFKLYGAGLLSSVGESQACMQTEVKKLAMSLDCVNHDYDITSMQPQLFVTKNWLELIEVLEKFADTMGFRKGGTESLIQAIASQNVATAVYSSGLQVSGKFVQVITEDHNNPAYIKTLGGTALAFGDKEISGHGPDYHVDGFGSPVGKLQNNNKPLEDFSDPELEHIGMISGKEVFLQFKSGIEVKGKVTKINRVDGKITLIRFAGCQVTTSNGTVLFQPEWGMYDMAVGEKIVSVFSGSGDKEKFNVLPGKSEMTALEVDYDTATKKLFSLYQQVRDIREDNASENKIQEIYDNLSLNYPDEWLLRLEILEQIKAQAEQDSLKSDIIEDLKKIKNKSDDHKKLIESGMNLLV